MFDIKGWVRGYLNSGLSNVTDVKLVWIQGKLKARPAKLKSTVYPLITFLGGFLFELTFVIYFFILLICGKYSFKGEI